MTKPREQKQTQEPEARIERRILEVRLLTLEPSAQERLPNSVVIGLTLEMVRFEPFLLDDLSPPHLSPKQESTSCH